MNNLFFLLSKDCMSCESLPVYGNTYWKGKMPNIDELAAKGTVFNKYYTAGGSTSMSMSAMLSGHYLYEFESRKLYVSVKPSEFPSLFDIMQQKGYECHVIWDILWVDEAWRFVREFGDESKTTFHNLDIGQPTGRHPLDQVIVRDDALLAETYRQIKKTLEEIVGKKKKQFIWLHLPHILKGRRSYMDDMDAFDNIVGDVRRLVGDENIYLTADHGHMNMHKGKTGYGFDLYEPIIHIPLITPRLNGKTEVNDLMSNIDLPGIILEGRIQKRDYIISETAYYAQPQRKMAIVTDRFKYIYNKKDKSEELYDLQWDPEENYNILRYNYHDPDRGKNVICDELYFYPYRQEALKELPNFQHIRESIWRDAPWWYEHYGVIRKNLSPLKNQFRKMIH